MDLRHLRNMLGVIEEGSLGRASKRLNLSQPALTKSIQRLEEQLGVKLFERDARGMTPTFYAESLRGYAKAACVSMAEAQSQLQSLRNGTEGTLTIAAPPMIATELLPKVMLQIHRERPQLHVRIVSQNKELFADLADGKFNAALAMLYAEIPDTLTRHWVFDDELVVVARAGHPMLKSKKLGADKLFEQQWALPDPLNWTHRRLSVYFEQSGLSLPKARMQSLSPAVLKSLVANSDLIAVLPKVGIWDDVVAGRLKWISLNSPIMRRPVGIVLRKSEPISPLITCFIKNVEDVVSRWTRGTKAHPNRGGI